MDIQRVRFRMSGGYAGLVRGVDIATDQLSEDERAALERLAAAPASSAAGGAARDLVVYDLELKTDTGARTVHFDEMSVPGPLAGLIARLKKQSRPVQP